MAGEFPGGLNTLIPLHEASGHLIVSFGRNPKSYPLNNYLAMQTVTAPRGAYVKFDPLSANRTRKNLKWAYGMPRPRGHDNKQGFTQANFITERYQDSTTLDQFGIDIASFPVVKVHAERLARIIMINRTNVAVAKLLDSTQYAASHVTTATALGGGFTQNGTTANPIIQTMLQEAAAIIQADTGRVRFGELSVVINAKTAMRWSRTREIREYVMQKVGAEMMITDGTFSKAGVYSLPEMLYGFKVYVEDTFSTSDPPDLVGGVLAPAWTDGVALVCLREGDLEKEFGDHGYSTATQFVYEDMTVGGQTDEVDRLHYLYSTDQYCVEMTAPLTGVLITNLFA